MEITSHQGLSGRELIIPHASKTKKLIAGSIVGAALRSRLGLIGTVFTGVI
jgi:hypothetical protein